MIKIIKTPILGCHKLIGNYVSDERGFFQNMYRQDELVDHSGWSNYCVNQINISYNYSKGTIRGIHLQTGKYSDSKIVYCISGSAWDVCVDLRKESKTYAKWYSLLLTAKNRYGIIIPEGCGHAFQAIQDNTMLLYIHSQTWDPQSEYGIKYDDPLLNIKWPYPPRNISKRDLTLPFLS